jgi:hypothetical protein
MSKDMWISFLTLIVVTERKFESLFQHC